MTCQVEEVRLARAAHVHLGAFVAVALTGALLSSACTKGPEHRVFSTPEDAVVALHDTVKAGNLDDLISIFGPEARDLIGSSDAANARRNQEVFLVAFAESWRLDDHGASGKELVIGHEDWPFPVPLVQEANGWRFDTAAGREEVLDRRIGRNELAVIRVYATYVVAQRVYALGGHDGKRSGLYAQRFASDPGTRNGLYWTTKRGERPSPLGDLVAQAAEAGYRRTEGRTPLHGYYFRILTAQGAAAPGGARDYLVDGELSGGFALVAWPAFYDESGITTFIVNQDGIVYQKDLGPDTPASVEAMTRYDPDTSWSRAPVDGA